MREISLFHGRFRSRMAVSRASRRAVTSSVVHRILFHPTRERTRCEGKTGGGEAYRYQRPPLQMVLPVPRNLTRYRRTR